MIITKTALTVSALAATGYARLLGRKVAAQPDVPLDSGTDPTAVTPPEVMAALKQLKVLQWVVPALTGALIVFTAYAGEQQRPAAVKAGATKRLLSK